ncbi:hypothetical protein HSTV1_34 [Haloarcula sinaiiensis tailed virus 1]|uniref:Uncharacterized protein n=1 Tax=Haloarcula sinaiiensis tailed virus 1 TaxID=1262530 RepID=R9QT71_9CAUD|nr:hypothetical protein HSTV1_34 [Haloarcula sinaiiensis tailed virus 1]AGC34579.1 hypothetical protein HSTV1_34 [Haloarcula sinaiiensis tailed virus 1]
MPTTHYRCEYPTLTVQTTDAETADAERRGGARVTATMVSDE